MLNDAICFQGSYIVCGYKTCASGGRLAALIETQDGSRPMSQTNRFTFFCGRAPPHQRTCMGRGRLASVIQAAWQKAGFLVARSPKEGA